MKRNVIKEFLFRTFMKKKFQEETATSCQNLGDYCESLLDDGRQPPSQILLIPATADTA